jgi:heme O synthase-like polyprenyltransferase
MIANATKPVPRHAMSPKAQAVAGVLLFSSGAIIGWSGLNPVDGAMMLIWGAFLASCGGFGLLRGRGQLPAHD